MHVFLMSMTAASFMASVSVASDILRDNQWESWKNLYGKRYESVEEELMKRLVWENNLRMVDLHNFMYTLGLRSRNMEMDEFSDLARDEFLQRKGSQNLPSFKKSLPESKDWRNEGCVTPVKNQGQCGSSWAFSATGALECQYFKSSGTLVSFSEQQLMDCTKSYGNQGCESGWMDYSYKYVRDYGIESGADYPYYTRELGYCYSDDSKVVTKISGYVDIPSGDERALQEAVANHGPVSVAIDATKPSFNSYRSGIYIEPTCGSGLASLDHAVLVVGYGTEGGQDYWLVKNSWGTYWGMEGYMKMARNRNNQCGIATKASYPIM